MLHWKPLREKPNPTSGMAFTAAGKAAKEDRAVALYYTPERGWYGWCSVAETDDEPMERIYPVLEVCGKIVGVPGSVLLKAAAAVEIESLDEIN